MTSATYAGNVGGFGVEFKVQVLHIIALAIDAVFHHEGFERRANRNRLPDNHVIPGQHFALAVESDFGAMHV